MASDPRVQHLLRRAGFGASAAEAATFSQRGFTATLDALVDYHRTPDDVDALIGQAGYAAVTPSAGGMEPFSPATSINDARQRWLFRMVHTRRPLQEKMALFWHQHFATAYSKIANAVGGVAATQMMAAKRSEHPAGLWSQLELFRDYALPNFRDLLFEVARDPAMLYWLDGRLNTRARPQENFAREVMELFTIGVGQFVGKRRLRRRARVHRLEPAAHRRGARPSRVSISSSTTPRSTTRTRRRSAFRFTPTARRRFPRGRRRRACRTGSTCSPRSRAIRKRAGGWRASCGRFSSARFGRPTRHSSARIANVYTHERLPHGAGRARGAVVAGVRCARRAISPGTRGRSSSSRAR